MNSTVTRAAWRTAGHSRRVLLFLFHFSALSVLPFWLLMIALPRATITERLVRSPWISVPPTLCYIGLLLMGAYAWSDAVAVLASPSPEALGQMMAQPWAAGMFWAYAGAFDLFVGRWMFFDSRERGVPHVVLAPILFVAIFFGPVAFGMYAAACGVYRRRLPVQG